MRSALIAVSLAIFSFSAVAQQTGSPVPPPFQAKRLPPEKAAAFDSSHIATQLPTLPNILPATAGQTETPLAPGITVPLDSSLRPMCN